MMKSLHLTAVFLIGCLLMAQAQVSKKMYDFTANTPGYWPAAAWGQTSNATNGQVIFFDDVQLPRDSIGPGADSIGLTAVDIGVFRAANAPATTMNLWVARFNGNFTNGVDIFIMPPRLIASASLPQQGGTNGSFIFRFGDSLNVFAEVAPDSNIFRDGVTTFFLGVSYSDTTGNGVFLGTGAVGFGNIEGAVWEVDQSIPDVEPFGFGTGVVSAMYVRVFGRAVSNPLPVTLTKFEGKRTDLGAHLNWNTATEESNAGFELERSADGKDFSRIAHIASKAPGGNSTQPLDYSYDDNSLAAAGSYYRLRQLDFGGQHKLSEVIFIKGDVLQPIGIKGLYPNPAKDQINLAVESAENTVATLGLIDMMGRQVTSQQLSIPKGFSNQQISTQVLSKGVYRVRLITQTGEQVISSPFIKE